MTPTKSKSRRRPTFWTVVMTLAGILLIGLSGWYAGGVGALSRFSYDLLFYGRVREVPDLCLVYMDDGSGRALDQNYGVWDRKLHARLIRRLTEDGAKAIFFDLVFYDQPLDPESDLQLAAAMKAHGRVFVGAKLEQTDEMNGVGDRVLPPTPTLRRAAAGWGLLAFRPIDPDYGVRYLYTGTENVPTLTWRMAEKLGALLPSEPEERMLPRWLSYYRPDADFHRVPYDRAIRPGDLAPGFFKDKVVFVGSRAQMATLGLGKDDFANPSTRFTSRYAPGVEIHATAFQNLMKSEWLGRWEGRKEDALVLGLALLLGVALPRMRIWASVLLGISVSAAIIWWARGPLFDSRLWFVWAAPALVQTPIAVSWAALTRYVLVERRRGILHRALKGYLSDEMADLIANSEFDLSPGGKEVEATVMFTDLEGFTTLSEGLTPSELSKALTVYFTRTTQHVLETRGTIVKFIGDAVMAVWGAPLPDEDQASRAALAACRLQIAADEPMEIQGKSLRLRTRVGIHTGIVLSGNLGSAQRFDYTVIGDTVNFAARLEGLNKYLGTRILISAATQKGLAESFWTRCAGDFRVVGKSKTLTVYELLSPADGPPPPWVASFTEALVAYRRGELQQAREFFSSTIILRGSAGDPLSTFYLRKIEDENERTDFSDWDGVVNFDQK